MNSKLIYFLTAMMVATVSSAIETSGKILLTGGVSQIEGSGGGGLAPWAVIGGYGTEDEFGAHVFHTNVNTKDYTLETAGALLGIYDRIELSYAKQSFNIQDVGAAFGLGQNFRLTQNVYGLKVKVYGDAVLEQDSPIPQVAIGVQFKQNEQEAVVKSVGAKEGSGFDYYISATKILLNQSLLYTVNLRATKANQLGILGFGGDKKNEYQIKLEGSLAYLINQNFVVGVEYRQKTNNLGVAEEKDWSDLFLAWAPTKNISVTAAYAELGDIVGKKDQNGLYSSVQIGF